jgi:hypothetical protein
MADFCNQCKRELGLTDPRDGNPESDYPDYGALSEGYGWSVICEGCGFTLINRKGDCLGNHSIEKIKHKELS